MIEYPRRGDRAILLRDRSVQGCVQKVDNRLILVRWDRRRGWRNMFSLYTWEPRHTVLIIVPE